VLADEGFLADIRAAEADALHLWWLGQSGFLVKWNEAHLLLDPYLSDSLTEKYAGGDTPHVRMTRRVVDPAALGFVDVVTASHGHTDHLDAATLRAVRPRVLVCPEGIRDLARERALVEPRGLEEGETIDTSPFRITAVRAEHDVPGPAVGYVVGCDAWRIYHSGDTISFDGMGESLRRFELDVAILPINGKVGNMSGIEAATVANVAGAKLAVPCHFEMFEFNTAPPDGFRRECDRLGQSYRVLRAGERLTLAPDRD
jgi:L-ascorbate metabolism protein UlaG (beta-lactamase superfamily)